MALCEEATAGITRFDAESATTVAPFAALLLRSKSASSSKIENVTASAKAIALAELGDLSLSATNANLTIERLEDLSILKEISGQHRNRK